MSLATCFEYGGLSLRAECPNQAHLTWLEEFLSPAFGIVHDDTPHCTVTLDIDDRRHQSLRRGKARRDGANVRGFVLDRGSIDLVRWSSPQDARVFYDADSAVFYCVAADATRIVSSSRYLSRRLAHMRVIREMAMSNAWTPTRFVLHAAACEIDGGAVIMAGPKGAGKTTLLMHALESDGARFVSNDRLVVDFDSSPASVRGMPTVVTIREPTLRRFPAFARRWEAARYHEREALKERVRRAPRPRGDAINLTPAQFCDLLDVRATASSTARLLLFPQLTPDLIGVRVRPLAPEVAMQRLATSIFAAPAPQISEVFALPGHSTAPDMDCVRSLTRALVQEVRCFDCDLGISPDAGSALSDFLARAIGG